MPAVAAQIVSLFLLTACAVSAQTSSTFSSVSGRVLDASQLGIGAASVTIVNQENGFRRTTETHPDGSYAAGSLEPGLYKITVRHDGFRGVERFDVELKPASGTRADFDLEVGSRFDTVTVRGAAPLVNSSDATTGTTFTRSETARLPVNGGGLANVIDLAPGANTVPATRGDAGQFTVNGQRANTNYFTIDGVSANTGVSAGGLPAQANGGTLPSVSAFGSFDTLIPLTSVEDLRVQTSSTVAQFGRMPGANIGVSSQAGANESHGSLAYLIRNELIGANDWFSNRAGLGIAPTRLHQVAATFGGPIRRNTTFFFASYEKVALLEPFTATQAVPSLDVRQSATSWAQPALHLFPTGNQGALNANLDQWTGGSDQPAALQAGSARIDQAIGSRLNFFGRYADAPSQNQFGSVAINDLHLRTQSLTLGLTFRPAAPLTLDTRANESMTHADSLWTEAGSGTTSCSLESVAINYLHSAASCDTLVRLNIDGVGDLNGGREGVHRERQFQFVQSGSLRLKSHEIGFGADFRRITAVRRDAAKSLDVIAGDATDFINTSAIWYGVGSQVEADATVNEFSAWAQDTWRPIPRLSIAAGLRWEFSPPIVPAGSVNFLDPATKTVTASTQSDLWPIVYHDFAPRLGVAWQVTKDGRTVIRAGGGIYYESSLSIATDVLNGGPLAAEKFTSGVHAPFSTQFQFGFEDGLRVPEVRQWNVAIEHSFGDSQSLSLGYVGADGHGLLRREAGGPGSVDTSIFALTTNHGFSNYQSLQALYRRAISRNLQASAAYTWSHSLDNDSSDAFLLWAGSNATAANDRGSSDYDVRHSFTASLSYQPSQGKLKGWRAAAIVRARTGFPITVVESQQYNGIAYLNAFRPSQLPGAPIWLDDANAPGGKRLNSAAFFAAPTGVQGTLGRNAITGFGMWQTDLSLSREFRWRDRFGLDLRLESFDAFNHPNFADPVRYLDGPLFGQSTSMLNLMLGTGSPGSGLAPMLQTGGPRMFQGSLRFRF